MSLRGVERRSNLCFGQVEIASGFALAMTVFESVRVIKTDTTSENPYNSSKSSGRFAWPILGFSERRFNGFALSELRDPLRSASTQTDTIIGNRHKRQECRTFSLLRKSQACRKSSALHCSGITVAQKIDSVMIRHYSFALFVSSGGLGLR